MESHLPSTIDSKGSASQASSTEPDRDAKFLAMLPRIRRQAAYYLRRLSKKDRADAVQEVVSSAFVSYVRLVERGKSDVAYAGPLARYAACQYLRGRRVGSSMNVSDLTSNLCRQKNGVSLENSITSTTQLMNGSKLWWRIGTRAQLKSPGHGSILVTGSSRCPSGPGIWPKPSPLAKRPAMSPGCSVARHRG